MRDNTVAAPTSSSGLCFGGLQEEVGGAKAILDGPSGTLPHAHSPRIVVVIGGAAL